jgi:hypothetical protein
MQTSETQARRQITIHRDELNGRVRHWTYDLCVGGTTPVFLSGWEISEIKRNADVTEVAA